MLVQKLAIALGNPSYSILEITEPFCLPSSNTIGGIREHFIILLVTKEDYMGKLTSLNTFAASSGKTGLM